MVYNVSVQSISTVILASDKSNSDHVTWILASDWSISTVISAVNKTLAPPAGTVEDDSV